MARRTASPASTPKARAIAKAGSSRPLLIFSLRQCYARWRQENRLNHSRIARSISAREGDLALDGREQPGCPEPDRLAGRAGGGRRVAARYGDGTGRSAHGGTW